MPRAGNAAEVPWAGDLAREVPTSAPDEPVGELRERVLASGYDFCVVVNDERVVLGLLRGDALAKDEDARAEDAMELGPKTTLPSEPIEDLLEARSSQGVKHFLVATSHGVLLGGLDRDEAERALAALRGQRLDASSVGMSGTASTKESAHE